MIEFNLTNRVVGYFDSLDNDYDLTALQLGCQTQRHGTAGYDRFAIVYPPLVKRPYWLICHHLTKLNYCDG